MPDKLPSNVKIYDRPDRKGPNPLVLGIALVVLLLLGFLLYKTFFHPTTPSVKPQIGLVPIAWASSRFSLQEGTLFL